MADVVVVNQQLLSLRALYTVGNNPLPPSWVCRLFVNQVSPQCTDTMSDYTECTLAGYGEQLVPASKWVASSGQCEVILTGPTITFTFTGSGQTIYGHLMFDQANNVLGWVTLWDTPFPVPVGGALISLIPVWNEMACTASS